ncbi:MAG: hypothetical protein RIG61_01070 [Deltaproteobacteria bacterium]
MPDKKTDEEKFYIIIDSLGTSVLDESDDEIMDELRRSGVDMDAEAVRLKTMMLDTVKVFRQRSLKAARTAYDREIEQMEKEPYPIPETAEERRELFLLLTQQKQYAQYVTAQYRNLEELTDNDIKTYLEDLAELGILQELDRDEPDGKK